MTMPTLKERFERFMSALQGVENIDTLMKHCNLPNRKKADYLAFKRLVIIEQKSFDVDVDGKVQAVIDDFVHARGTVDNDNISFASFVQIIAQLPDGNDLRRRLRQILTQKVDDVLAEADKQTRDTRKTFFIPEAVGMVVVLNETAQLIEPDFFVDKAFEMLRKRLPTGEIRYPENHVAMLISEAHRIQSNDGEELIPIETVFSEAGNQIPFATVFTEAFRLRWAEFNQSGCMESPDFLRDVITRDPPRLFRTT
jgi:hypothetical protein